MIEIITLEGVTGEFNKWCNDVLYVFRLYIILEELMLLLVPTLPFKIGFLKTHTETQE